MRLLIRLYHKRKIDNLFPHYLQIQGLIYSLLRNSKYKNLHGKKFYKFFCFSNIFLENKSSSKFSQQNQIYNLIVSSPNEDFLKTIAQEFLKKEKVKIKKFEFVVKGLNFFDVTFTDNCKIVSSTPIIIRIPKEKCQEYGIKSLYSYLFWRPQHPLELFIKQLEANIYKKYKAYYSLSKIKEIPIFQQFLFKKSVSIPLNIHGKKVNFIGSLWEFHFNYLDPRLKKILQFAIDAGFGENNSKGFGFMNVENL